MNDENTDELKADLAELKEVAERFNETLKELEKAYYMKYYYNY